MKQADYFALGLVVLGLFLLYFCGLGAPPLLDPDEPIYGTFVRTMLETKDWVTPRFHGEIWYDKPPLYHWLAACAGVLVGPQELAWRLPSALGALGVVLLTFIWGTIDLGSRKAGFLAALIMGTSLQQIILARAAVTDMTLVLFLTAGVLGYRMLWTANTRGRRCMWALLSGIALGLGMLTKGPISLLLPGGGILLHLLALAWVGRNVTSDSPGRTLWKIVPGELWLMCFSALLVGLPWFIVSWRLHPEEFWQDMVMINHVHRFLQPEHPTQTGHWYSHLLNIPILFIFFFPWSTFLLQSLRDGLVLLQRRSHTCFPSRSQLPDDTEPAFPDLITSAVPEHGMFLVWGYALTVFVFFSISKTILVTYIFPMYPAVSIIVAAWLQRSIASHQVGHAIENKVEQPTEQLVEKPAEQPTEQLVEKPVEQPTEQLAEQPVEQPTEQLVEQHVEQPTEQLVEKPVEQPVEQLAEQPVEQLAEQPHEAGLRRGLTGGVAGAVVLLLGLLGTAWQKYPEAIVPGGLLGITAIMMFAVPRRWWLQKRLTTANMPIALAGGMVVFALVLVWAVIPAAATRVSVKELLLAVKQSEHTHIIAYRLDRPTRPMITAPSLGYYFRGAWSIARNEKELETAWQTAGKTTAELTPATSVYVLCRDGKAQKLIAAGADLLRRLGGFSLLELGTSYRPDALTQVN